MKTYKVGEANDAPHFIEKKQNQGTAAKVYPMQVTDQIFNEAEDREYDMVFLENDYICVHLLPEIGGKIYGALDKGNGYEFIYENPVVKPALIGLCGPWVSGGVEFNWPQHHRPTTYTPMEYKMRKNPDGSVTCFMGELEPLNHMRGMAAVTVFPDSSLLRVQGIVTNCTDNALPYMWWNNTAVRVHKQYKAIFPPDVEFGSDHDRRAIISFPVMKGVFQTARRYDYGEGTDTSWYGNVKVSTSVMIPRGQTSMDFLGGYDFAAGAGTVMIHDHHVSPGAKMFTWGDSEFGKKWCSNLTDNEDRYMELMTGSYTDNQPDFAYIEAGETKEFATYWYPIRGIGDVSNATLQGAIVLSQTEKAGQWKVGACVTSPRQGLRLELKAGDQVVWTKSGELDPWGYWLEEVTLSESVSPETLKLSLVDETDGLLVAYCPPKKGEKQPPKPRKRAPRPQDVDSVEMLYIYGRHLRQYKHPTYCPEDYYLEALRRDPEDYRCSLEMGKAEIEKGRYQQAERYLKTALKTITFENTSPEDTECYYQMGRLLRLQGRIEEAYGYFRGAAWQYSYHSPGCFESACIDCARGNRQQALALLREAIATNTRFYAARTLLGYLTGDSEALRQLLEEFPLDGSARYALFLLEGRPVEAYIRNNPEAVLDGALLFEKAGLTAEAVKILRDCQKPSQNLLFHLAALTGEPAEEADLVHFLPNRLEDIPVLKNGDWRGQYLVGCLYYDRENYEAAIEAWENSLKQMDQYGYTWRNLALAYHDHGGKPQLALPYMRKAVSLNPEDKRMVYELMNAERETLCSIAERIETTKTYRRQIFERDDAWLDAAILRIQNGEYETAQQMLLEKDFHIYEGGEGKLTKYHRWLHVLKAWEAMKADRLEDAGKELKDALVYPLSYGEGVGCLEQDANVHYFAGLLEERKGNLLEAGRCYEKAEKEPDLVNEILYFTGLCEEKLGHWEAAKHHYQMLLAEGEEYARYPERYGYFGVGMDILLPFESDIRRHNLTKAHLLCMLAYKGLKKEADFQDQLRKLRKIDPDHTLLAILDKLELL